MKHGLILMITQKWYCQTTQQNVSFQQQHLKQHRPNIKAGLLKNFKQWKWKKWHVSWMINPVLIQKISEANILNKYVIDELALDGEYPVLRLSTYGCVFNSVEILWSQLKHHARCLNVYSSQSSKVVNLIVMYVIKK